MATIIKSYEPTFWDKLYIPALVQGLLVTFKHLLRKKVTIQYPEEKLIPPEGYRGLHRLNKDANGRIKVLYHIDGSDVGVAKYAMALINKHMARLGFSMES